MNIQFYFGTRNHRLIVLIIFIALLVVIKPTLAATLTVNTTDNTNDGICNAAHCSLFDAIMSANASPNSDIIEFNIPGINVHTIFVSSSLPPITAPVIIDGSSQPGYSGEPLIELNGSRQLGIGSALVLKSVNITIRGLIIDNFWGDAIQIVGAGGDTVTGCYLGTDPSGMAESTPYGQVGSGIRIEGVGKNVIGGVTADERNVIAGNWVSGIYLLNSNGNTIAGNYIGISADGMTAVQDPGFYVQGIHIEDSANNIIGGTASHTGNVISGHYGGGVVLTGSASIGNKIQGNYIGTNVAGTSAIPNTKGILLTGIEYATTPATFQAASNTLIGGISSGARNLISGNSQHGIYIEKSASNTTIQGNWIGTDTTGNNGLPNAVGLQIATTAGTPNLIGGSITGAGNLVSGNSSYGMSILLGPTTVQGNIVGLNASATSAIGNQTGIGVGPTTLVGGTIAGAGNVVAGNTRVGISVGSQDSIIQGNFIGTNSAGTLDVGAQQVGIDVTGNNTTIGGTVPGAGNLIAHNAGTGILVSGNGLGDPNFFVHNPILGNRIYDNDYPGNPARGLGIDLSLGLRQYGVTANDLNDVDVGGNTVQNYPELFAAGTRQDINSVNIVGKLNSVQNKLYRLDFFANDTCDPSGYGEGQFLVGTINLATGSNNTVRFTAAFQIDLPPGKWITATATSSTNDTSEFSACVKAIGIQPGQSLVVNTTDDINDGACDAVHCSLREAITLADAYPDSNPIIFNIAGGGISTIQLTTPLPPIFGPVVLDATTQPGFIGSPLIVLSGSSMTGSAMDGIGLNVVGSPSTSGSTIRGFVVSGFSSDGIKIEGNGGNHIEGNYIGTNSDGTAHASNGGAGVKIFGSSDNVIGGMTPDKRNIISGNLQSGINVIGDYSPTSGNYSQRNQIIGNYIGVDINGALPTADSLLKNAQSGILLDRATNTIIGGISSGARNVIGCNDGGGILIRDGGANSVVGNYIGTDFTGTKTISCSMVDGITVQDASLNTIGGITPGAGNLIAGWRNGININGLSSSGNALQGNLIGIDSSGTKALPNHGDGITIMWDAASTMIGGNMSNARNIISGNDKNGVMMTGDVTGTAIQNNFIGTDITGSLPIPNGYNGIETYSSSKILIGGVNAGNRIGFNAKNGVTTSYYVGIQLVGNSIFENGLLGFDLGDDGPTPNYDYPLSNIQNKPVLSDANSDYTSLSISGSLASVPSKTYRVEFFASKSCDTSRFGEGASFLGAQSVSMNNFGIASFKVQIAASVALGQVITATATSGTGNTSEFSACFVVVSEANAAPIRNYGTSDTLTLTWNPLTWTEIYQVQVSNKPTFDPSNLIVDNAMVTDTFLTITVPTNETYYWRVRARKPDNTWSVWSIVESFVIQID